MTNKSLTFKKHIGKNILIHRQMGEYWSIIIIPQKYLIDNYYHGVHIHCLNNDLYPERTVIPIKNREKIFDIVDQHLTREKKIVEHKLRKELGL